MTAPVFGTSVSGTSVPGTSVKDRRECPLDQGVLRHECPLWPDAAHGFPADRLDEFLLWAADRGASDIAFQTGSPAFVEIDGRLERVTAASLDGVVMGRLCERLYDATGEGILRSGRAIDCSHSIRLARGLSQRFRCNLAPVQGAAGFAVNITLRVLPGRPPTFSELGTEEEIVAAWDLCKGLVLVTGVPGSGKSTLLAAGTRRLLERGAGRIQSYEAPIEYVFDGIAADAALMSSAEIPRHFPSFAEGLRSSLRRRPSAVVVGEARDRETVEAVVRAADYGIAVFSTTHTIGVAATVRRMLAEFPAHERPERGAALIDAIDAGGDPGAAAQPEGRSHGVARVARLRRGPEGRAAGEPAGELAREDRRSTGAQRQRPRGCRAEGLRQGADRRRRAQAHPRGKRDPRRAGREHEDMRTLGPETLGPGEGDGDGSGRGAGEFPFTGEFPCGVAGFDAPGALLRVRRAPVDPGAAVAVPAQLVDDDSSLWRRCWPAARPRRGVTACARPCAPCGA